MLRASILSVLLSVAVWAQQPFLPTVIALPGPPNRTIFGLYNGYLVRTSDQGLTWIPVYITEPGLPQPLVQGFAIDPFSEDTLYLATTLSSGGFLKSIDGGVTWNRANTGLPSGSAPVDFFQLVTAEPPFLYLKVGNQLFRSDDRAFSWSQAGFLPSNGTSKIIAVSEAFRSRIYYVNEQTLQVFISSDEGHSWQPTGTVTTSTNGTPLGVQAVAIGLPSTSAIRLYVSLDGVGAAASAYMSTDSGATFTDQSDTGLGVFSKISPDLLGPSYATSTGPTGFFRSFDDGKNWKGIGLSGIETYTFGTFDPKLRTTVYAIRGGTSPSLVVSTNSGDSWQPIASTISPTLAKPLNAVNVVAEEGAPYSQSFKIQLLEDPTWTTAITVATSGEPWLALGSTSGNTPLANSLTITTTGLAPGSYQASIRIDAPRSFNKSVTIPVKLTVRPFGSLGPQYAVTTVAGNGNAVDPRVTGKATDLGIGAVKALAFDPNGRLLISAGNRIWQQTDTTLTVVAGTGTPGSNGDGADPTQASISDPEAIVFDPQGTLFFTEFASGRVRRILGNQINTSLEFSRFNNTIGSHSLVIDSFGRFLLTGPAGLLRFDGLKLAVVTPFQFSDPFGMAVDGSGNYYISDRGKHQIFRITPAGEVSVVAGLGSPGFGGDSGPATQALLNTPSGLAFDAQGTLYFADTGNQRIRAIAPDGSIRTIAGSGASGFTGDNATADFAAFRSPVAVAVDAQGNLFVADSGNNRVRRLAVQSVPAPKIAGLLHGASGAAKLSPGSLFSVFGEQLAGTTFKTENTPWPRSLFGVSITINGLLAPLYFVSPGQINGQIPYETTLGTATAVLTVNGSAPVTVTFQVVAAAPGILVYNGNRAVAVNQNGTVNAADATAAPADIMVLYLSGIGQPDRPVASGAAAPTSPPFALINFPSSITVGGQAAQVLFFGLAPGFPALVQANFRVPNLPAGDYPVVVTVNGEPSNAAIISVRPK